MDASSSEAAGCPEPKLNVRTVTRGLGDGSYYLEYEVVNEDTRPLALNLFWWYCQTDSLDFGGDVNFDHRSPINVLTFHTGDTSIGEPSWDHEPLMLFSDAEIRLRFAVIEPGDVRIFRLLFQPTDKRIDILKRAASVEIELPVYTSDVASEFSGTEVAIDNPFSLFVIPWPAYGNRDFFVVDRHADSSHATLNNPDAIRRMRDRFCGVVGAKVVF